MGTILLVKKRRNEKLREKSDILFLFTHNGLVGALAVLQLACSAILTHLCLIKYNICTYTNYTFNIK